MARKKIDWDAEIRKTENIKRRGLLMSGLSFALACALIFGMSKYTGKSIELPKTVIGALVIFVSCMVLRIAIKKRNKKLEREQNHDA